MAAHETTGETDEWYTPEYIFDAMGGVFDLDVASPGAEIVHWIPARHHLTRQSLESSWDGLVWMNAPYGGRNGIIPWMRKFIEHGNGVAIAPNRTGAPWWQEFASACELMLFLSPKVKFIRPDNTVGKSPGYGSVLFSIGAGNDFLLRSTGLGMLAGKINQ